MQRRRRARVAVLARRYVRMIAPVTVGTVESVNVSAIRTVAMDGRMVTTGIYKTPVNGRVALRGVNLSGDDQADRDAHGGPERAVYAYAGEDSDWWSGELKRDIAAGTFGENLMLRGIDVSSARIGERWRVGSALLAVTSPRVPCYKLAHVMHDPGFVRAFARALRPGAYLRVVAEGDIAAGDVVEVVHRPDHTVTVAEIARIFFFDRTHARELLAADELPESWREWAIEHGS